MLLCSVPSSGYGQAAHTNAQAPPVPAFVDTVDVIATTPLSGVELTLDQIPSPVQSATASEIEASGALDVTDFLNRRVAGVHINEVQGNPFQADVNYRGYTASPLLGTPQGLSIYMDGVRMNQPFGEVVSWDLIPRLAVSSSTLTPGSNPIFGLNTLGGALSLQTKDGQSHKGTTIQGLYGSHVRRALELEHGGALNSGVLNWYFAGNLFGEDGWRDDSPSDVRQIFGKVGWQRGKTRLNVSVAQANNSLTGNALQELRLLDRDYASVYTKSDVTDNRSTWVNATMRRAHSDRLTFSGNAYYRYIRTNTSSGDVNQGALDQSVYQPGVAERAALAAAGYADVPASGATAANTPFPFWRCLGNVLLNDEPGEKCNGLINRTHTRQHNGGLTGQATLKQARGSRTNQLTVGAGFDRSGVGFVQSTELGYINPDRSITGTGAFADGGVTGGDVDGVPFDARVDLDGHQRTFSLYATDTLSLNATWHLTLSGRYNRTSLDNRDQIDPGGGPGSLDGDHVFARFNPAVGLTFSPSSSLNLYAGYSEGSRAATSIELGCADLNQPCKLPNALAGDPPLNQVAARTVEAGVRGGLHTRMQWNAGVFFADNRDDILFVSSTDTGFGYFRNFGRTQRQGLELGVKSRVGRLTFGAGYNWLAATFQSAETVNGSGNSTNDAAAAGARGLEGTIEIEPGNRIPFVPQHTLKAYAELQATSALSVDIDVLGVSSSLARGNENAGHAPDGTYYLGPGESPGYAVVDLGARYRAAPWLQIFAQLNNLFDRRYYSAAQLGPSAFTEAGTFVARPFPAVGGRFPVQQTTFFAPGAPRAVFAGTRLTF
jgi:outer membrane receptor protein involved in Fe transport